MSQRNEKTLQTICLVVGVFLVTMLLGGGLILLSQNRNVSFSLPKDWISDDDLEALKNPEAANKAAYEKMSRDAWERSQSIQPQPNWDQGWRD